MGSRAEGKPKNLVFFGFRIGNSYSSPLMGGSPFRDEDLGFEFRGRGSGIRV